MMVDVLFWSFEPRSVRDGNGLAVLSMINAALVSCQGLSQEREDHALLNFKLRMRSVPLSLLLGLSCLSTVLSCYGFGSFL